MNCELLNMWIKQKQTTDIYTPFKKRFIKSIPYFIYGYCFMLLLILFKAYFPGCSGMGYKTLDINEIQKNIHFVLLFPVIPGLMLFLLRVIFYKRTSEVSRTLICNSCHKTIENKKIAECDCGGTYEGLENYIWLEEDNQFEFNLIIKEIVIKQIEKSNVAIVENSNLKEDISEILIRTYGSITNNEIGCIKDTVLYINSANNKNRISKIIDNKNQIIGICATIQIFGEKEIEFYCNIEAFQDEDLLIVLDEVSEYLHEKMDIDKIYMFFKAINKVQKLLLTKAGFKYQGIYKHPTSKIIGEMFFTQPRPRLAKHNEDGKAKE